MASDKTFVDSSAGGNAHSSRHGPYARMRAARRRGIVRSAAGAVAAVAVSIVLLLPARFFGAIDSSSTASLRTNVALLLALIGLAAALYAAIAAHRTATRQRPLIRRMSMLTLLVAALLVLLALASVLLDWR